MTAETMKLKYWWSTSRLASSWTSQIRQSLWSCSYTHHCKKKKRNHSHESAKIYKVTRFPYKEQTKIVECIGLNNRWNIMNEELGARAKRKNWKEPSQTKSKKPNKKPWRKDQGEESDMKKTIRTPPPYWRRQWRWWRVDGYTGVKPEPDDFNAACIYCDGHFSVDFREEVCIRCYKCGRWTHSELAAKEREIYIRVFESKKWRKCFFFT